MLNLLRCDSAFENVGFGDCVFNPREIIGMHIVPSDFVIKESDMQNLQSFLEGKAFNKVKAKRIFPVMNFVGLEDNSEEPTRETLGYGITNTLKEGNYGWTFRFVKGGLCLLKSLQRFNSKSVHVIFVDGNGVYFGKKKTVDGEQVLSGVLIDDFWANKWGASDGAGNSTSMSVFLSFEPSQINQNLGFIDTSKIDGFDIRSIVGVKDLEIVIKSATDEVIEYQIKTKCGGSPSAFSDVFETEMTDPSNVVLTDEDGLPEVIDSITYNDITNVFKLTLDPVRTTDSYFSLADIETLATNGVEGFESNKVLVPL